jgi:hypothetical protein
LDNAGGASVGSERVLQMKKRRGKRASFRGGLFGERIATWSTQGALIADLLDPWLLYWIP